MTTTDQLENKILNLEKKIQGIITTMDRFLAELTTKVSSADLSRTDAQVRELITDLSKVVQTLDSKLAKVILPEESRYYLEGAEVEEFQSNFLKLKSMMIQFDKLYKNLVAYEAKRTS